MFRNHDAQNLLLEQAPSEVLARELDVVALRATMMELQARELAYFEVPRPTPFAFPLMVERLRERVSTETLRVRVERMVMQLETTASL